MCLTLEAKVLELRQNGKTAFVEFANKERFECPNLAKAKKGEKVLIQQGLVVEKSEA